MSSQKRSFEEYRMMFPSAELLARIYGTREDLVRRCVIRHNLKFLFFPREPVRVYGRTHLTRAIERGELKKSKNPFRRLFPYVIDLGMYAKYDDPFRTLRVAYDHALRCSAMSHIRRLQAQSHMIMPQAHIFKDGMYGEAVDRGFLPKSKTVEDQLCHEFIWAVRTYDLGEGAWWQFRVEGRSVWLEAIPEKHEEFQGHDRVQNHGGAPETVIHLDTTQ